MPDIQSDTVTIVIKRYAAGKAFTFATGDRAFAVQATHALGRALVMDIRVDRELFVDLMRKQGVPEPAIDLYVETTTITDEAWLQNVFPS